MLEAIKQRRSIRQYTDKEIADRDLEGIIEAAKMAPSPFNLQPWKFFIVTDKDKKREIRKIYDAATEKIKLFKKLHLTSVPIYDQDTSFLETATLVIPCYDKKTSYSRDSLAMAIQNMMVEAAARGIGSVCTGRATAFGKQRKQIKQLIGTDRDYEIPYIVVVGYSAKPYEEYAVPTRKPNEQVMVYV